VVSPGRGSQASNDVTGRIPYGWAPARSTGRGPPERTKLTAWPRASSRSGAVSPVPLKPTIWDRKYPPVARHSAVAIARAAGPSPPPAPSTWVSGGTPNASPASCPALPVGTVAGRISVAKLDAWVGSTTLKGVRPAAVLLVGV